MKKTSSPAASVKAAVTAATLLLAGFAHAADEKPLGRMLKAEPGDFALKLEAGVLIPLSAPQSTLFGLGGAQTLKALWALNEYFDLGPSVSFMVVPNEGSPANLGTAWTFGAGVRIKRPHHAQTLFGLSPWADVDALYVRTGPLNRPGFAAAVGVAVPLGKRRAYWLGPFARYTHIIQLDRPGFDNHDAKLLTIGLSLELGGGVEREAVAREVEIRTVNTESVSCPDGDGDGIPDGVDHCPVVAGPMDFWGCPAYKKLVVKKDKLELKEKLYFAWNSAILDSQSNDTLDEVVQALKDNRNFRVQVEGHTSSEGGGDRNQTLSEARAQAVLDYLVAHGVGKERLISKGFASSVPLDTNQTPEGRENNRRVEFVVSFIIINEGGR